MSSDELVTVSIVIPTGGRPDVALAVESALQQQGVDPDVVVVVDGTEQDAEPVRGLFNSPSVRVLATGAKSNANRARNVGIGAARAEYVALLDDDDVWLPGKIRAQLDALGARGDSPSPTLVTTAVRTVGANPGHIWPERGPEPREDLGAYLFRRTTWRPRPHILQTSTWLALRSTFLAVPFDDELAIHQDWDWLLRARVLAGFSIVHVDEALAEYTTNAQSSTSTDSSRWPRSLAWATDPARDITRRDRGDLILAAALPLALRTSDPRALATVIRSAYTAGRPSLRASVVAAAKSLKSLLNQILRFRSSESQPRRSNVEEPTLP